MPKIKTQSKINTTLWKKVSKAMQDFYRRQSLHCYGRSKSCTGSAQVMHHWLHFGSCKELRLERMNLIPLCQHCHLSIHSGHQETSYMARKLMEGEFGTDWEDQLMQLRREAKHRTPKEEHEYLLNALVAYQ